jgi:hypothetical protein
VVQHVTLQLARLATEGALPALQAVLDQRRHVGKEGSVSLLGRGVPRR